MPTAYVKKVAAKKGQPVAKIEKRWQDAKKAAEEQGHKDDFDYITGIFKSMNKLPKDKKASVDEIFITAKSLQR